LALAAAPIFAQGGDVAQGKALVESSGCTSCHRIGDKGSRTGPDLSEIGDKRTPERLKSAIVNARRGSASREPVRQRHAERRFNR